MHVTYGYVDAHDEGARFLKRLAKAVRFNDADLADNRLGKISSPQLVRLALGAMLPFAGMALSAAGLAGIAIGLAVGSKFIVAKVRYLLAFSKYLAMGLGALFFGLLAFAVKFCLASGRIFLLLLDVMEGRVVTVSGRVTPSRSEELEDGLNTILNRNTETYSFVVKDEYFEVPGDAHSVMMENPGANFRLYVTPRSRYMVAIEFAEAAPKDAPDPFTFKPRIPESTN
jgi:hypothetical protein